MHRVNVAIFLTAIGLIGLAPVVLSLMYLARRRADRRGGDEGAARRPVAAVVAAVAILLAVGGVTAWLVSDPGTAATSVEAMDGAGMAGMPGVGGTNGDAAGGLPILERLADEPLTPSVTGPDAIEQVAQLHGSTFPVADAVIATYGNGRATIWVSAAPDAGTAKDQVMTMRDGISEGGSPFAPPQEVPGMPGVYATSGMGQRHFFFSRDRAVWWIAVDPAIARRALNQIMEVAT